MLFEDFEDNVRTWAKERGILDANDAKAQTLKFIEEAGEVVAAVLRNDHDALVDGIGDVLVTLVNLGAITGVDLEGAMEVAWLAIKYRKGKIIDGCFVKEGE